MVFNPRAGEVADGTVTTAKLADNAVVSAKIATNAVTSTQLATDAVTAVKIASDSVTTSKIADNAIITQKINDAAVTLGKAVDSLRRKTLYGSETDISQLGTSRKRLERFKNAKDASQFNGISLEFLAAMKISAAGTATLEVWFDNDSDWNGSDIYTGSGTPALALTSTSTAGEIKVGLIDISMLSNGNHVINVSMNASGAGLTASSDYRQYFIKE